MRLAYEGNFKELKRIYDGANKQEYPSKKGSNKTSVAITEETSPDEQETESVEAPTDETMIL